MLSLAHTKKQCLCSLHLVPMSAWKVICLALSVVCMQDKACAQQAQESAQLHVEQLVAKHKAAAAQCVELENAADDAAHGALHADRQAQAMWHDGILDAAAAQGVLAVQMHSKARFLHEDAAAAAIATSALAQDTLAAKAELADAEQAIHAVMQSSQVELSIAAAYADVREAAQTHRHHLQAEHDALSAAEAADVRATQCSARAQLLSCHVANGSAIGSTSFAPEDIQALHNQAAEHERAAGNIRKSATEGFADQHQSANYLTACVARLQALQRLHDTEEVLASKQNLRKEAQQKVQQVQRQLADVAHELQKKQAEASASQARVSELCRLTVTPSAKAQSSELAQQQTAISKWKGIATAAAQDAQRLQAVLVELQQEKSMVDQDLLACTAEVDGARALRHELQAVAATSDISHEADLNSIPAYQTLCSIHEDLVSAVTALHAFADDAAAQQRICTRCQQDVHQEQEGCKLLEAKLTKLQERRHNALAQVARGASEQSSDLPELFELADKCSQELAQVTADYQLAQQRAESAKEQLAAAQGQAQHVQQRHDSLIKTIDHLRKQGAIVHRFVDSGRGLQDRHEQLQTAAAAEANAKDHLGRAVTAAEEARGRHALAGGAEAASAQVCHPVLFSSGACANCISDSIQLCMLELNRNLE